MLIEPTPALPPSRGGRARLVTTILVPAVLLGGIVGVGALTRGAEAGPAGPADPSRPPAAATDQLPDLSLAAPSIGPAPVVADLDVPSRALGLPTRTVSELLSRRRGGAVDDALHAAGGWLTVRPGTEDCFIGDSTGATLPMIKAVGCRREVILAQTADPLLAWVGDEVVWLGGSGDTLAPDHLHIPVFHGVSLASLELLASSRPPIDAAGLAGDPSTMTPIEPVPVVIVGRFDDPRVADPRSNADHVNEIFTLERIVWSAGALEEQPPIQLVAPPAGAVPIEDIRARVSGALPSGTIVLNHVYLPLGQLTKVDAAAAGGARLALQKMGSPSGDEAAVWYVRVMVRDGNPVDTLAGDTIPRRLGWVVSTADGIVLQQAIDGSSRDD